MLATHCNLRPSHTLRFFSRRLVTTVLSRRKESWDCLTPCDSLRLILQFYLFCPHLLHCDANISKRIIKTMNDELKLLLSCGYYLYLFFKGRALHSFFFQFPGRGGGSSTPIFCRFFVNVKESSGQWACAPLAPRAM